MDILKLLETNSKLTAEQLAVMCDMPYEEVVEKIKQDSRHYAKRQITWFKKVENVNWYNVDDNFDINKIIDDIIIKLQQK